MMVLEAVVCQMFPISSIILVKMNTASFISAIIGSHTT